MSHTTRRHEPPTRPRKTPFPARSHRHHEEGTSLDGTTIAFLSGHSSSDPLAEELGEGFLRAATGAQDDESEALNVVLPEEFGGPFIETSSHREFGHGTDASNPRGSKREPFPRV